MIEFRVIGKPQGKARPRFNSMTHRTYTPSKTKSYEHEIAVCYKEANGPMFPADVCVGISVDAVFPVPKSWPKKKKQQVELGILKPMTKPDIDNILKVVLDGLNGVAYEDDRQVVRVTARKRYDDGGGLIIVRVWEIKE